MKTQMKSLLQLANIASCAGVHCKLAINHIDIKADLINGSCKTGINYVFPISLSQSNSYYN